MLVFSDHQGFPRGPDGKQSACNARDQGSVPGLGRSPGEGNVCLPTPVFLPGQLDGQSPWGAAYGVKKSWTQQSNNTFSDHIINSLRTWAMSFIISVWYT